jgi:hypothetical protein
LLFMLCFCFYCKREHLKYDSWFLQNFVAVVNFYRVRNKCVLCILPKTRKLNVNYQWPYIFVI